MGKRKTNFIQHILYMLEYIIVVPLAFIISLIPWFMVPALSRFVGWLGFHLNTRDKMWAYENFDIIYKDNPLSKEEKDTILRKLYRNIGRFGIEYMKIGRIKAKNYHKFAEMENFEALNKGLSLGKGLVVVTLHLGNWEWLGSIPAKLGIDLAVVINRQFNPYTDAWLKRLRVKKGKMKAFYNEVSDVRNIAKHLKNGGVIALLADQTYYFKPIFVPFFGLHSATADGPAKFHFKFGAPIVMCYSYYQHDKKKYKFVFKDPIIFDKSDDPIADNKRVMTWVNQQYEKYIRKYPDQWFSLLHPRWEHTQAKDFDEIEIDPY